ncbi:MAG TPA: redoxin domain-containing protein [Methanocella sp.]|uniref:peroxiredoxin family protein n=1 Tax=Methanocella sp. TaxID=2052833 RepID=UPI002CD2566B|nr:redoxin domain-containing protein [Methanocella sp.]HTY92192.1 redoxin domain-containing protein [Methanocella sp.]
MEYGHKYEQLPVEPGYNAPDFTLKDETGNSISLKEFRDNQSVVLVFIRAVDDAHTSEQLDYLKDSYQRILYHCGNVLTISYGSVNFNKGLAEKHNLPFHILSDEDCSVLKKYQIYNPYEKLIGPNIFILNCAGLITYMYNGKNPEDIVSMADIIAVLHDMAEAGGAEVYGGIVKRNI